MATTFSPPVATTFATSSANSTTIVGTSLPTSTPATITSSVTGSISSSIFNPIPTSLPTGAPLARWVAIDDVDTDTIQYTGDWISIENSTQFDAVGNYGTPYLGTLHAITNGTGSIAFSINSTRGEITGTTRVANTSGTNFDPKWFCTIDGSRFMPDDPSSVAQNNWPLCDWDGLSAGVHVITLNATSKGQTFYFDQLSYIPATGAQLTGKSIIVPWSDPKIVYDDTWAGFSGTSMMTTTHGATWNFTFEGTSVEWFSMLPAQFEQMHTPSNATYAIDNGTPVNFNTGSLPSGSTTPQFNYVQLKTPEIPAGTHTLSVQFLGETTTAPLFLQSLIVHNTDTASIGTTSSATASTSTLSQTNTSGASTQSSSKQTPIGIIVGATVGGSAVLLIIILTIWYLLYKAREKRRLEEQLLDIDEPLPPILHPFPLEPKAASSPLPSEVSESPPYHSVENDKLPYSITNRRTLLAPPDFRHSLQLQIQNASLSTLDVSEFGQNDHDHEGAIVHRDSGIRLIEEPAPIPKLEYPPVYTPR